jgi:hypothetical protein
MRDPKTLAHRIVKPIPSIRKQNEREHDRYGNGFHWQMRIFSRRRHISPFIYVFGYELYFDSFIEIWHTDPLGDIGPPCHGRKWWRLHLHHMSISPSFWYDFRQKHITRCSWCRKKSSKELGRVNHSNGTGIYHSKCMSEFSEYYHSHDPRGCYACSGKSAFEFNRKKEYDQRLRNSLFGSLKRVK